jgi:hypothetical protein
VKPVTQPSPSIPVQCPGTHGRSHAGLADAVSLYIAIISPTLRRKSGLTKIRPSGDFSKRVRRQ